MGTDVFFLSPVARWSERWCENRSVPFFLFFLREKLLMRLVGLDVPWVRKVEYDSEGADVIWLPVAKLAGDRFLLGLTRTGFWARSTESGVQAVKDETNCIFLLPILESPPEVVRSKLIEGLKLYGLSEEFIDTFPFEKVVMAGLNSQSEYWSSLALKWVLFVSNPHVFKAELEALSESGETQRIRHAAKKIVKQFGAS